MNEESNGTRAEDRSGLARFSAIQLAIAGLACALVLVILLIVSGILTRA